MDELLTRTALGVVLVLGVAAPCGVVAEIDWSALTRDGEVDLSFRYRFENVDDDDFAKEADASTLRSRLSLATGEVEGIRLFVEFEDVHEIGPDDFNAGAGNTPSRGEYPVVADPEGTEVNQVYLAFARDALKVRLGRQRINLDNQRFVGGVGWRQNEQTFDALKIDYGFDRLDAQYIYVNKVRTIFGDDVPAGTDDQDGTHLVNLSGNIADVGKLTGYYYRIDSDDRDAASTTTLGARLTGARETSSVEDGPRIRYALEYARQDDAGDNPQSYSADYWHLEGGLVFGEWDVGVGWEVLGGDDNDAGEAFRTPFATLHLFNGWVDRFLATPDAGLDDRYVKAKFARDKLIAEFRYHDFEAADGGEGLGDELDLRVGYKINQWFRADLYYGRFDGDGGTADVSKLWLMLTANL